MPPESPRAPGAAPRQHLLRGLANPGGCCFSFSLAPTFSFSSQTQNEPYLTQNPPRGLTACELRGASKERPSFCLCARTPTAEWCHTAASKVRANRRISAGHTASPNRATAPATSLCRPPGPGTHLCPRGGDRRSPGQGEAGLSAEERQRHGQHQWRNEWQRKAQVRTQERQMLQPHASVHPSIHRPVTAHTKPRAHRSSSQQLRPRPGLQVHLRPV